MIRESLESGCPPASILRQYAAGTTLTDRECLDVEAHLLRCANCCAALERASADGFSQRVRAWAPGSGVAFREVRLGDAYEMLEEIGRGGCGVVYKARQPGTGRLVALKRLHSGALSGREGLLRFRREARALARLRHPHIVEVYDSGEQNGEPYLAMELVCGEPLSQRLRRGALAVGSAAQLTQRLAEAAAAAHAAGIVHRDLKPSNVLLSSDGSGVDDTAPLVGGWHPKIVDFGLAKGPALEDGATCTGMLIGTPGYMAPEQVDGPRDRVGSAADVYALGAILYECVTGRPPFAGATQLDTLRQVLAEPPAPPRQLRPAIPKALEAICLKCLEKDPRRRYATAIGLADDLGRFLQGAPVQARPPGTVERACRWALRHRVAASALMVFIVVILAALAGVTVHQRRLQDEIQRTRAQTAEANRQRRLAEKLYEHGFLALNGINTRILQIPAPESKEYRALVDETLRESIGYYGALGEITDRPRMLYDLSQAYQVAGLVAGQRGDVELCRSHFRSSEQILIDLVRRDPAEEFWSAELARTRVRISLELLAAPTDVAAAERLSAISCAELERYVSARPGDAGRWGDLAWGLGVRFKVLHAAGDAPGAVAALRREVDLRRRICAERPACEADRRELAGDEEQLRVLESALRGGGHGLVVSGESAAD